MEKQLIKPIDHVTEIVKGVKKGALITAKVGDKVNPMTISWGKIGIEWNKLIFITYVRTGRYTHKMLEQAGEFTVNIPMGGKDWSNIIKFCGTKSGRDYDKVKELDLTLVEGEQIATPGIKEIPLTLECKIIYKQLQDKTAMPQSIIDDFYPETSPSDFHGSNADYHTMFFGEVLDGYIIK